MRVSVTKMNNFNPAIITLTTDFGLTDAYVASMKGVILGINPGVTLVDITHNIPPQDVRAAAFILHTSHTFFPDGTIHVVIVDPGVGTSRRPITLLTPNATYVAPDNGVLSYVIAEVKKATTSIAYSKNNLRQTKLPAGFKAFNLDNPVYWRHPVSHTFHGRDIFSPAAAYLSLGVQPDKMGSPISSILTFPVPRPERQPDGSLLGHIQHIDSFGNLISDVKSEDLPSESPEIEIQGQKIKGLSHSYAEGQGLVALIGSSGYLEIALKNGNATRTLAAKVGESFIIR